MKPLSPAAEARRFSVTQILVWLFELVGPGLSLRAATRALNFDGATYEGTLLETPAWNMKSRASFGPGGLIETRASLLIADAPDNSISLGDALSRAGAAEFSATLRLLWLDENGAADPADAIVMLRGGWASFVREPGAVRLELADPLTLRSDQRVLREFDSIPGGSADSDLQGRALPVVFGVHDRLRLTPFELGRATKLAAPLAIDDDQAFVESIDGFSSSGIAQIGDELIQFDAVEPPVPPSEFPALGTPAQPLVRLETPLPHGIGETVREEPPGGFTWFVADHPCESVGDPRAANAPIAPGTWSSALASFGDRDIQLIQLDRVPSGAVTARVEGWPLAGGGAAVSPVDILEILLTDPRFAALDPASLEMASFVPLRDDLESLGFAFARVLDSASLRLGDLIDSAAREMACWLCSYHFALTLARADPLPPLSTLASLGDATALDPIQTAEVEPEPGPLPSGLLIERTQSPVDPDSGGSFAPFFFAFEPVPGGTNEANPPIVRALEWIDTRSQSALEDLARRMSPAFSEAAHKTVARHLPAHLVLEPGDPVGLTRAPIGLAADGFFLESLETDGPAAVRLRFRGPLAGPACFSANADSSALVSFVRPFGGGRRLLAALNGNYIARLAWNGRFSLTGDFTETDTLVFTPPYDPAEGPIAIHDPDGVPGPGPGSDDRLVFASGDPGAFVPFFFLTDDPVLVPPGSGFAAFTSATLVENVPLPAPPASLSDCVLADADGFTLYPHPSAAALRYDAATNELRLAGELVEGAILNGS